MPDDPRPGAGQSIRDTTYKQPGGRVETPATKTSDAELTTVNATTVLMNRSGSEQVTAERVTMERCGARSVDTKSAQLDRSGVVALSSEHTVLLRSSAVQVVAEEARLSRSSVAFLFSDKVELSDDSRVLFFAGSATGDVRAAFTPRTAAIFGAAAGVAVTALLLLARAIGR
jgi:hypothetical protein